MKWIYTAFLMMLLIYVQINGDGEKLALWNGGGV